MRVRKLHFSLEEGGGGEDIRVLVLAETNAELMITLQLGRKTFTLSGTPLEVFTLLNRAADCAFETLPLPLEMDGIGGVPAPTPGSPHSSKPGE